MITQFVNNGTDLEVLNKSYESMPLEQQEELSKALKREGLVQKQITVQGKHGTYTKIAWVKAGDNKLQTKQSNNKNATKPIDPESLPSKSNPVYLGDDLTEKIGEEPDETGVFQTGKDSFVVDNGQSYPPTYTREEFMQTYGVDPLSSKEAVKATDEDWAAAEAHAAKKKKK